MYIKGHIETVDTKDQMLLCIEHGVLFVDTVDTKIKASNAFNAMFVTLLTLVFAALTQHLIQSTMRCENSA